MKDIFVVSDSNEKIEKVVKTWLKIRMEFFFDT